MVVERRRQKGSRRFPCTFTSKAITSLCVLYNVLERLPKRVCLSQIVSSLNQLRISFSSARCFLPQSTTRSGLGTARLVLVGSDSYPRATILALSRVTSLVAMFRSLRFFFSIRQRLLAIAFKDLGSSFTF